MQGTNSDVLHQFKWLLSSLSINNHQSPTTGVTFLSTSVLIANLVSECNLSFPNSREHLLKKYQNINWRTTALLVIALRDMKGLN